MNLLHPGASLHGHEYSPPLRLPQSRSPSPRIALHRSQFSAPTRPSEVQDTARPSLRTSVSLSPTKISTDRVSFLDPDIGAMSDDGRSAGHSDGSRVTARSKLRSRKSSRHTSTSYYLAHPAPTLTQKQRLVHIRPRLLLQLQQLSAEARPKPTIDVISSSTYVPRLAKKFPGLYRGNRELGINDVIIVRSDDYCVLDEETELDAGVEDAAAPDREILAVVCQVPKAEPGTTEICLEDGSRWNAGPSTKGVLELYKTNPITGERTIARWVPRGTSRRNSVQTPTRRNNEVLEPRYQFSFIDPSTRRHPVLATLTQGTLKISNTYSPVSSSEEAYPPVSSSRTSLDGEHPDSDTNMDRKIITLSEEQRLLIEVSAVWVALRQGWSPSFKYSEGCSPSGSAKFPTPPSPSTSERPRSFSFTPSGSGRHRRTRSNTVTSIPESVNSSTGTTRSRRGVFARATFSPSTFQSEPEERAPPKRTVSNGAAFMQKAAARKATRHSSAWSSGSDDGSRSSSPRRRSISVDITEGAHLSNLLVPSPQFQLHSAPITPGSPTKTAKTKTRNALSAYGNLENIPDKKSQSQINNQSENQRPGVRIDSKRQTASPQTLEPQSGKKENRRFSSLIRFFKGKSNKRS